jgi:cobalt-zinc-cadmium efflux system outer membrane protein
MKASNCLLFLCGIGLISTGCAVRRYRPAPISPQQAAVEYETRNLNNPGLRVSIEKNLGRQLESWPPKTWDPAMLTLAALYYHSDMAIARAGINVAEAGVITAGARPNPSIRIAPGVTDSPESPWLFSITPTFPIETAGKRGYRIQMAKRVTEVARLQLAETAWQIRARLRAALLDFLLAKENLILLRQEEQVRTEIVKLLERRFEVGEIPRPDLDTAQIELSDIRLAIRSAEGQLAQARATLAAAIGLPESALDGVEFLWPGFEQPPTVLGLPPDVIRRTAVVNRLDLRRSLAEYAFAEASLQSEIAKQYPDVQLGPGYSFDDGANKFTVGVSLTIPAFNRNQGPIAEAEARRSQAEARFLGLQAQIIGEGEKALAAYTGALSELDETSTGLKMQQEKERLARQSFDLGEIDNLTFLGIRLQTAIAARARWNAVARTQGALGALENAAQKPLATAWLVPGLPSSDQPHPDALKGDRK